MPRSGKEANSNGREPWYRQIVNDFYTIYNYIWFLIIFLTLCLHMSAWDLWSSQYLGQMNKSISILAIPFSHLCINNNLLFSMIYKIWVYLLALWPQQVILLWVSFSICKIRVYNRNNREAIDLIYSSLLSLNFGFKLILMLVHTFPRVRSPI